MILVDASDNNDDMLTCPCCLFLSSLILVESFKHFSILSLLSCTDHNAPLLQCQRGDGERGDAGVPCRPGRPPRRAQVPRQRVRRRPLRSSSRRNGAHPCSGSDGLSALHQVDGS